MIFLSLVSLSPVLRTLSAAVSSDSIWALAALLFMLNALLSDYTSTKIPGELRGRLVTAFASVFLPPRANRALILTVYVTRLTSVLAMNAAIVASVVLASRLDTDISVFALILFAVQSFILYPILKTRVQVSREFVIMRGRVTNLDVGNLHPFVVDDNSSSQLSGTILA